MADTAKKHWFPFTGEQTVNILGEFGPLMAMFIVNGIAGIQAGTWALIVSTVVALIVSLIVIGRPPVMPFIAGAVSIGFGVLTLVTGDAMWVQIKVTIFNVIFALVIWIGLWTGHNFFEFVFGKTFHFTKEGWRRFTNNFAWFFVFTAFINEAVRLGFDGVEIFALDRVFTGIDIWILFKLFIVMPLGGLFAWWQTRVMHQYRMPADGAETGARPAVATGQPTTARNAPTRTR